MNNKIQLNKMSGAFNFSDYTNETKEYRKGDTIKIQMMRQGKWCHTGYGDLYVDEEMLGQLVENFSNNVYQQEIPLNENHDKDSKAVGWFKNVYIEEGDLYGDVKINTRGAEIMNESIYKYVSVEYFTNYKTGEEGQEESNYVLIGAAVTNHPYFKNMKKIVANEQSMLGEMDRSKAIYNHKKPKMENTNVEIQAKKFSEMQNKIAKFDEIQGQLEETKRQYNEAVEKLGKIQKETQRKEFSSKFDMLVEEGKGLIPGDKEKVVAFCESIGADQAEVFFEIIGNIQNVKEFSGEMVGDESKEETNDNAELTAEKAKEYANKLMQEESMSFSDALAKVYSTHSKKKFL